MEISATVSFADAPRLDLLLVPGGHGQLSLMKHTLLLDYIRGSAESAQWACSVCTGALLLAQAGVFERTACDDPGAASRWPFHRVVVRTDCAPVVRSRFPSSDTFRAAVHEVRERTRRGHRVVRYISRKANPAHELAREGLKTLIKEGIPVAA